MKFGAPFWGAFATRDPVAVRDYVQAVEGMGGGADFVIVNYLHTGKTPRESWLSTLEEWQALGVTHAVILPPSGWEPGAHRLDEAIYGATFLPDPVAARSQAMKDWIRQHPREPSRLRRPGLQCDCQRPRSVSIVGRRLP